MKLNTQITNRDNHNLVSSDESHDNGNDINITESVAAKTGTWLYNQNNNHDNAPKQHLIITQVTPARFTQVVFRTQSNT